MKKYLLILSKVLKIFTLLAFSFSIILVVFNLGFIPLKYRAFAVASRSMYPTLEKGDLVFADQYQKQGFITGDIIVFEEPGYKNRYVIHRVVEEMGEEYITKGDNNATNDNWKVSENSVQGLYVKKIARIGDFLLFLRTLPGITIFIIIPVIFLIILELNVIINEIIEHRIQKAAKQERITSIK